MNIEQIRAWTDSKYRKPVNSLTISLHKKGISIGHFLHLTEKELYFNVRFSDITGKIEIRVDSFSIEILPEEIMYISYTEFSKLLNITIELDIREYNRKVMSGYFDGE